VPVGHCAPSEDWATDGAITWGYSVHSWPASTLRQFLDASRAANDRHDALWVLLATTGMRRGEALGLRWNDVDLDAARIRIVQTIIQTRSVVSVGEPKTAGDGAQFPSIPPRSRSCERTGTGCSRRGCSSAPTSTIWVSCSTNPMGHGFDPTQ
jgi:hypothetical protein